MERIHFTAPDGTSDCLDAIGVPNARNRSQKICTMLNIEEHLKAHREALKKKLPKKAK